MNDNTLPHTTNDGNFAKMILGALLILPAVITEVVMPAFVLREDAGAEIQRLCESVSGCESVRYVRGVLPPNQAGVIVVFVVNSRLSSMGRAALRKGALAKTTAQAGSVGVEFSDTWKSSANTKKAG